MEEIHKGKVWGGRKGLEVKCGERFLWGWGFESNKEAVGCF